MRFVGEKRISVRVRMRACMCAGACVRASMCVRICKCAYVRAHVCVFGRAWHAPGAHPLYEEGKPIPAPPARRRNYRGRRQAAPIPVVALVGYTNAGGPPLLAGGCQRWDFLLCSARMHVCVCVSQCAHICVCGACAWLRGCVCVLHGLPTRPSGSPAPSHVPLHTGKSTLLNQLTMAGVLAEDKLFATLDPTTRKIR